MPIRTYKIVSRYMQDGSWKCDETEVATNEIEVAWNIASQKATELDNRYSNSHFWTVELNNPQGESYVQLFHGRLS